MRRLAREVTMLLLVGVLLAGGVTPVLADTDLEVGGLAIIANTNTDPVMVRSGAGYDYTVLTTVEEGDIVTVLDGPIEGDDGNLWYEVDVNGLDGFVFADFLVLPINAPRNPVRRSSGAGSGAAAGSETGAMASVYEPGLSGHPATISGTGGDGARLRDNASPDAAIILAMPEGASVNILTEPHAGGGRYWYLVSYQGVRGYVAADFLGGPMAEATTAPAAVTGVRTGAFESGAHVKVSGTGSDDLRIRGWAGTSASIHGHAPAEAVLLVLGGPELDEAGNHWYVVDYDGLSGYARADFLTWTSQWLSGRQVVAATLSTPAPAAAPAPAPAPAAPPAPAPAAAAPKAAPQAAQPKPAPAPPPPPPASSDGDSLVGFAMRYVGYPYVYGGSSPGGFDCSGFTSYVVRQVLGRSIGASVAAQIGAGVSVSAKNLEPGDLVFFVNTYAPGLTHVGIYIGGGQMVHAGSERTGVTISNIWDSYWSQRYYGARRL